MGMNLTLDIDFEFADKITVANLKDCYERTCKDVVELEAITNKETWQEEDLEAAKEYRILFKQVLGYFMTQAERKEYFDGKEND
jgi:hypothetical protein